MPSSGKNTNCPVAELAVSKPIASPRRVSNQRLTMVAASVVAATPVPAPTIKPHVNTRCHGNCIRVLAAVPIDSSKSPDSTTGRMPKRCIAAAENGPIKPNKAILTEIANEITERLQPNSCSSGTIITAGVARMPAAVNNTRNINATTNHA